MEIASWVLIITSCLWVLFDAKSIGVKRDQLKGFANFSAGGWFLACLILWIIFFPAYLIKRKKYQLINGKEGSTTVSTALGLGFIALQVAIIVLMFTGDIKMSTADLQEAVQASITEEFSKNDRYKDFEVKSFALIHKSGNEYIGLLETDSEDSTQKFDIKVTYDGKQFMWKIAGW